MAVYTKVSASDLDELLLGYSIGKLKKHTAITAGIQNSNYFIDTDQARYVLTIYENSVHESDLPFFLEVMAHLAKHGVPCPLPILNHSGEPLSRIHGKLCAIVSFVEGHEVESITEAHVAELGKNLANMHIASHDIAVHRDNDLGLQGWNRLFTKIKDRMDEFELGVADEIEEKLYFLNENWPKDLPSGVIHSDLFPDNVLFNDDMRIAGIIDFYFACNDYYLYDFAVCVNAWCFDKDYTFNRRKAMALFGAYRTVRDFSDRELQLLRVVACGAAMRFFLTRMYDWLNRVEGAMLTPKPPLEYLQKMRFHFNVKDQDVYGVCGNANTYKVDSK